MNGEIKFTRLISKIFNPILAINYVFLFCLFYTFSIENQSFLNIFTLIKVFAIYLTITSILPAFTMFFINKYPSVNIFYKSHISDNHAYFTIYSIYFFIAYLFFTLLGVAYWIEIALLYPIISIVIIVFFNRFIKINFACLIMGTITFYMYYLTIYFNNSFSIIPFIISILFSGLVCYSQLSMKISSNKEMALSYLLGILSCITTIIFKLIFQE